MNDSRTNNTIRNIKYGLVNKVILLIFPFTIRMILIRKLGTEYLGLSSLFTSILQILNLTELGFSSAVVFSMYKPIVENDKETICALMNLYKKVYRIIGIVILIIGLALIPFLDKLINGSYPNDINIVILYLIYLLNTVLTYFLYAYKTVLLTAHQRIDVSTNVSTITSIIQYILQIIVLCTLKNYYVFVIVTIITTILNNIICSHIVDKIYPEYNCHGVIDNKTAKNIKRRVAGLMISKLCGVTRNAFDSIFISALIGLNAVAIYDNYYMIINSILGIFSILINAMMAGVGNSIASESTEKNHKDMIKFNFMYMWMAGVCTVCLACLYQPFMRMWIGEEYLFPYSIVILFCIYFYALKMGDIRSTYSTSAGLWWEGRYRAIAESILNIVLNYILGRKFGIYGIILGTLISLIIINFGYGSQIVYKYYFKNNKILLYFKKHCIYATITALSCIISYNICSILPNMNSIINIIIIGLISIIITNIIYLVAYRKLDEFTESKEMVINILRRVKNKEKGE